jgi:hypothetical protein
VSVWLLFVLCLCVCVVAFCVMFVHSDIISEREMSRGVGMKEKNLYMYNWMSRGVGRKETSSLIWFDLRFGFIRDLCRQGLPSMRRLQVTRSRSAHQNLQYVFHI